MELESASRRQVGIDLAAYLRHVGLPAQDWTPTVAALRRLHRAHVDAIAFNSVTTALGRVPALDLPTLERRMVAERRGGYCLEHVTLFAAVLDALGFSPEVRLCIVGQQVEGRPPTHLTVLARPVDDERRWMADVGFGVGVLGPVPVPLSAGPGEPVRHGSWEHRADVAGDGRIALLERGADGWRQLHAMADAAVDDAEVADANRWVALQPGSPFAGRLIAMRTMEDRRERLVGRRLEISTADGDMDAEELSASAALDALEQRFGVAVDAGDRPVLERLLETA
jgi:N-hydroxyarylamine O-acetyltransferase